MYSNTIARVTSFERIGPRVNPDTISAMVAWGLLLGIAAEWVGAQLGTWFANLGLEQFSATSGPKASSKRVLVGVEIAVAMIGMFALIARPAV